MKIRRVTGTPLALVVAAAVVLTGCTMSTGDDRLTPQDLPTGLPASPAVSASDASPGRDTDAASGDGAPRIATTDLNPTPVGAAVSAAAPSRPVRVSVGSVGIDAPVIELGLDAEGAVAAPVDFDDAGWYTGSAQPGQPGPAVLAGHVDSRSGPAAFYRLADVAVGDNVTVHREDGSALTFQVTGVEQYAKDEVPTAAIYGPTPGPQLRLITCGGDFDRAIGHYEDNVVVYATA